MKQVLSPEDVCQLAADGLRTSEFIKNDFVEPIYEFIYLLSQNALDTPLKGRSMGCTLNRQSDSTKQQREGEILSSGSWICLENKRVSIDSYPKGIAREK